MKRWFRRLADIPGVGYEGSTRVDRAKLPGHDAVPEQHDLLIDGKHHEFLSWPTISGNGTTDASPVQRAQRAGQGTSTVELLQHLNEVLELPGEPDDYHF